MDEASRARIRIFLNDPAASGQPAVPSEPPLDTERHPWGFRIEGDRPAARPYEPDTPEFLYWQIASALSRGRSLWTRLLPGAGTWIPGPVLPSIPIEGEGLNAYYDRKALHFFRGEDSRTGAVVHSGDSPDIVVHEQGHAVLDAIRPDLWDAPHFEVAAFHEAFGDLSSILAALAEPDLARAALEETKGALDHSNLVSRLAEELAAAVVARYGPEAALPDSLRDAVNPFRYRAPRSLPDEAPADALSRDPHSFCRVLTGACWDSLVRLYSENPVSRSGETGDRALALREAADALARAIAGASEEAASGAAFFRRFASALVREAGGEKNAAVLSETLAARGLAPSAPRADVRAGMEPEPLATRAIDFIRELLGASVEDEVLVRPSRNGSLAGRRARDLFLSGREYGPADGAAVEISDSFTVAVADSGYVTASQVERAGSDEEEDAREFVRTLARRGRIAGDEASPSDSPVLYREGKSHVVARERDGVRRLRRAWISGGER
ncbi:MAG: hypothetical protein M3542_09030 [Acidobacteriota bacterium]|nr:hypothetical protein [Acidobacteriota bacterium]